MEQEIKRLTDLLHETSPLSEDYSRYLYHIERLKSIVDGTPRVFTNTPKVIVSEPEPMPEIEVSDQEEKVSDPEPTPVAAEPVSSEPVVEDANGAPTKTYIRDLLSKASKSGIQIQPIIAKFVPEGKPVKFSEVPASKYAELEKELENAR